MSGLIYKYFLSIIGFEYNSIAVGRMKKPIPLLNCEAMMYGEESSKLSQVLYIRSAQSYLMLMRFLEKYHFLSDVVDFFNIFALPPDQMEAVNEINTLRPR